MAKKGLFKKLVAVSSLVTVLVSGSVMAYAASYTREISLGDSWMESYISASNQTAYAGLATGVTSDMTITAKAIRKDFDGKETWQNFSGAADQNTSCSASAYKGDEQFMYAEGTFRAWGNNDAYNSDYINCSNY